MASPKLESFNYPILIQEKPIVFNQAGENQQGIGRRDREGAGPVENETDGWDRMEPL
ncbi:hypothetical protein [Clostridium sp. chh4-2]|uniref:hypothetical protein n=1 Tax=Clostridium sp. chh4-2 TaxID=2067550 RepID=UPI0015E191F6|nr:hypothetical protein [Clostridium sp. chh4-2]